MNDQNPYHPLLPPDDPSLFYGREDATAFLRQHLVGGHTSELILILGRVGMGKTALLHQTPYSVDERYQTVLIDLNELKPLSVRGLIVAWAERIVAMMERNGASTYRVPLTPAPDTPIEDLLDWFKADFLDIVLTAIRRDRFLLLMLDNFDLMFEAIRAQTLPANFMGYLGDLLKHHERLDILAALDTSYEDQLWEYPALANLNLHFRLGHLSPEAALKLITEPVAAHYRYDAEALEAIQILCGGYPFLLHSVCRLLYRAWESAPNLQMMGLGAVNVVQEAALEETGEIMRGYWEAASPTTQAVLSALLRFNRGQMGRPMSAEALKNALDRAHAPLNQTQLSATLRRLEYDELIKTTPNGAYVFRSDLEMRWLENHLRQIIPPPAPRWPNRTRVIGVVAVLIVLILIAGVLGLGLLESDNATPQPLENAPPTATFEIDLEATRRANGE